MIPDGRVADSGEIVEIDPPRRLVLTWQNHLFAEANAEGHSRLTYELQPQGEAVKLTLIHEMEKPDSKLIGMVSTGWPAILSSLKSLLETGQPLEGNPPLAEGSLNRGDAAHLLPRGQRFLRSQAATALGSRPRGMAGLFSPAIPSASRIFGCKILPRALTRTKTPNL